MTRHYRCWIRAAAGPKPGDCGAMLWMTDHGPVRRTRWRHMCIPRIVKARIRRRTWQHSAVCCRWTAMPGSSDWPGTAATIRSSWCSAGRICGGHSSISMRRRSRRWPGMCWRAFANSMRSRPGFAGILPIIDSACARREVGRSWRRCMLGCRSSCLVYPPSPSWRKPYAMRSGTGRGWRHSSITGGSRWIRTWSSARSDR